MTAYRAGLFDFVPQAQAVILAQTENMRALCEYTGEGYVLLNRSGEVCIVTDSRYTLQAAQQAAYAQVITLAQNQRHTQCIAQVLRQWGAACAAFEDAVWTVAQYAYLTKDCPHVTFMPMGDATQRWRMKKTQEELAKIQRAAQIADAAFADALGFLVRGMSEREAAWRLEQAMRMRGAEAMSFAPIVAAGENGAKPHAEPGERLLRDGDLVVMDFGCKVDGYCSDMTRTVAIGHIDERCAKIYDITLQAQRAAKQALRPGVDGICIDAVARDIIAQAGYGAYFGHGLGHGVGLEIHELPRLTSSQAGNIVLEEGHVVTVEPGIYLPDVAGVRIEDLCVVTQTGARCLSHSPTERIVL